MISGHVLMTSTTFIFIIMRENWRRSFALFLILICQMKSTQWGQNSPLRVLDRQCSRKRTDNESSFACSPSVVGKNTWTHGQGQGHGLKGSRIRSRLALELKVSIHTRIFFTFLNVDLRFPKIWVSPQSLSQSRSSPGLSRSQSSLTSHHRLTVTVIRHWQHR